MTFWEFYGEHPVLGTIVLAAVLIALLLVLVFAGAWHVRRSIVKTAKAEAKR